MYAYSILLSLISKNLAIAILTNPSPAPCSTSPKISETRYFFSIVLIREKRGNKTVIFSLPFFNLVCSRYLSISIRFAGVFDLSGRVFNNSKSPFQTIFNVPCLIIPAIKSTPISASFLFKRPRKSAMIPIFSFLDETLLILFEYSTNFLNNNKISLFTGRI
ncbi:hypothetical protein ES705_44893 [subsurface metagenome]